MRLIYSSGAGVSIEFRALGMEDSLNSISKTSNLLSEESLYMWKEIGVESVNLAVSV